MTELPVHRPFFEDKPELLAEVLGRYPEYGRRSALMPLLWEVQRAERHISEERLEEIAGIVGVTATEVKGVMSFYSTFHEHPVGAYHLQVCRTLSCALAGGDELYAHLCERTGLVNGETDAEGRFSIQNVECLGSCGTAPVLQVNDAYYERVTRSGVDGLLEAMRRDELPEPARARGGDNAGAETAERAEGGAA
ncbi:MAG: NADH-quinone oxidoreductase subunit NuoE [Trueperaceae bacterium]